MTRSQQFIRDNRKLLECGKDYYNPDSVLQKASEYDKKPIRFLLIMPTPSEVKTVSSTLAAVNDFILTSCPNVFVDFAFYPNKNDIKLFDKHNIPYGIGLSTHLDASHFDIVGFSISVLSEVITAPVMVNSFSRCDKPIPLTWTERKDMKLGQTPLIIAGGITSSCSDVMFGELGDGTGRKAFVDFLYLGSIEKFDFITNRLEQALQGYGETVEEDKLSNQDFIDDLFESPHIYQPQAYHVVFDSNNQVIENTKINPRAQDSVRPYYPKAFDDAMGIGRGYINASGDNAGVSQVQVSEGCSGSGSCIFCHEGFYTGAWVEKTQEQILQQAKESKKYSAAYKFKPYSFNSVSVETLIPTGEGRFQLGKHLTSEKIINSDGTVTEHGGIHTGVKSLINLRTNQGPGISITPEHRQTILTPSGLLDITGEEITEGMWIPQLIGYYKEQNPAKRTNNYLTGLWYGDGYFGGNSSYIATNKEETKINKTLIDLGYKQTAPDSDSVFRYLMPKEFTSQMKSLFPLYKSNLDVLTTRFSIGDWIDFIAGWFDADGSGKGTIKITAKEENIQALKLTSVVLSSLGIRTRLSDSIEVLLNEKVFYRRDLQVVGLESRLKFKELFSISEKLDDLTVEKTTWSDKDKSIPGEFGIWCYNELLKINKHTGHNLSKFFKGTKGITVDRLLDVLGEFDIEPINLIKLGYRFTKVESISYTEESEVVDVLETKTGRWIAGGYVTHNCNYLTDYKGTLYELIKIYPKVSFINMRMEELGNDMDAMKMMKMIGSNRISAPMEGISPRVQNNLLNKNLSESALNNFMNDLIHMKMTDIKVGGIFTAYEEDEDFQWVVDFVSHYKQKAKIQGGNLPFRLKMTPMVHYHLTPCEYIPRKSAEASFWGQRWVKDKWYDAFKEAGIFFKVNGFRNSTFLEQCIIDLGESATPLFYKAIIKDMLPAYSLRSFAIDEVLDPLKGEIAVYYLKDGEKYKIDGKQITIEGIHPYEYSINGERKVEGKGPVKIKGECAVYSNGEGFELRIVTKMGLVNPFTFFLARNPDTYISIAHRIHVALEGSGIQKARDLIRAYEEGNIFNAPLQGICLKTFEGAPVVCSAFGARKDPLFMYDDVKLVDGKLVGKYRPLAGCESCSTPLEKKAKLARPTPQTKSSADLGGVRRLTQTQKIRILIKRNPSYDLLNPNNTAHTPVAKLLQCSDVLLEHFHSISGHSMFWQADGDQDYVTSGYQIIDTVWSSDCIKELRNNIEKANQMLETVTIVSASEELMAESIKPEDYNVYYFESTLPYELFSDSRHDYKGSIRIKGGMDLYEVKIDKNLKAPQFINNGKTIGFFAIPAKYNPVAYLQGYFTKDITTKKVVSSTALKCVLVVREASNVCKNCGKEKSTISMITGKSMSLGVHCTTMALLSNIVAKMQESTAKV